MTSKKKTSEKTSPSIRISEKVLPTTDSRQSKETQSRLIEGDNLDVMQSLVSSNARAKLIYMDPPFLSKALYHQKITINNKTIKIPAYSDKWTTQDAYLNMIAPRIELAHKLLLDDGFLFLHCDWRASAHIRILLDKVFGAENFLNEIIWHYGGRGAKATSGQFPRNHDTIFIYGKTKKARLKKVYSEELLSMDEAISKGYKVDGEGRVFKTAPRGDYTDSSIERLEGEGRIYRTKTGTVRVKYFLEKIGRDKFIEKKLIGDVWSDLPDMMHSPIKERTGYATQKPKALMERIIECSTDEGELIVDIFSGSGTTPLTAEAMGRSFIATDKNPSAIRLARARLIEIAARAFTVESTSEEMPSSKITIKKPVVKNLANGRFSIEVELKDYTPSNEILLKIRETIGRLSSSLDIVDYWTIDWDYDEENFNALWSSSRGHGKHATPIKFKAKLEVKERPRKIAVRAADVFNGQTDLIVIKV